MSATTVTLWPELRDRLATPYYFDDRLGVIVLVNSGEGEPIVEFARWVLGRLAGPA